MASLGACGQRGPLYLPSGPAASERATLPQTLTPGQAETAPVPRTAPASTTTP